MSLNRTSDLAARRAVFAFTVLAVLAAGCKGSAKNRADRDDDDERPVAAPAGSVAKATAGVEQPVDALGQTRVTWRFDSSAVGVAPRGFSFGRTGSGRVGQWVVRAATDAPTAPNVLAQEDSDRTDYRFPVAVADSPTFGDVSVSVRCKPVGGRVDQACGIVWRYQDQNNYYLTRANALEDNVCWYYVQNGRRVEVKRVSVKVASGVWHTLRADMRGDHVEVYFNDKKLIDGHDSRFTAPGKVGVWTKADSRTLFDNLAAISVGP
jgi:hypothetical protein